MTTAPNPTPPAGVPASVPEAAATDRAAWVLPVAVIGTVVALMACASGAFLVHACPILKEPLTTAVGIASLADGSSPRWYCCTAGDEYADAMLVTLGAGAAAFRSIATWATAAAAEKPHCERDRDPGRERFGVARAPTTRGDGFCRDPIPTMPRE